MNLTESQLKHRRFNSDQLEVGSSLKTLNGSPIQRYFNCGGKHIGNKLYFEKSYADKILTPKLVDQYNKEKASCPFEFKVVRLNIHTGEFAFIECPDFNSAREPTVGKLYTKSKPVKTYTQIYHHKWLFVDNDYAGFDVKESWEWSKKWLSVLTEPADGTSRDRWNSQLKKFNLL